jgi:hypothetical protein
MPWAIAPASVTASQSSLQAISSSAALKNLSSGFEIAEATPNPPKPVPAQRTNARRGLVPSMTNPDTKTA